MTKSIDEIKEKILSIEKLPTQSDCINLMIYLNSKKRNNWAKWCMENKIYLIVHDRLINGLYSLISELSPINLLEVCAGQGKLTYWLKQKGVEIKAVDNHTWHGVPRSEYVEPLDCSKALEYGPDMVIGAFVDGLTNIPIDVLRYSSVKYFVHLGNAERKKEWKCEINNMENITRKILSYKEICTFPTFEDNLIDERSCNILYIKKINYF